MPGVRDQKTLEKGIKGVAVFEAFKGFIVLVAGFAVLRLIHRDLQEIAENIVVNLNFNPARHYPRIFIEAASKLTDAKIKYFAAFAFFYSVVRFIEAYGLWHLKVWAEWFAIISGGIYIPIEIFELIKTPSYIKAAILIINIIIVAYLLYVRILLKKPKPKVV